MKKLIFSLAIVLLGSYVFAGGLLTNTNQSAQFIRMMSRNAALGIDAVYYNPAGLTKLEDGWHFSLNSQTIFQDKSVYCGYPLLNDPNYLGKVAVPVFPTAYAAYKKNKWAFSFGFGPNAGGGSAEFERGLPSFEIPISKVVPGLAGLAQISPDMNVQGYNADLYFTGSSIFWGFQLGATYEINEKLSVYGGVRILPSKNVYQGSIKNIMLDVNGTMNPASEWLTKTSGELGVMASVAYYGAGSVQPIIDNGGGSFTLSQLEQAQMISPEDKAQLEGGLILMGVPQEQIDGMNVSQIQGAYTVAGDQLTGISTTLSGTAAQLGDKEVDTEQTGTGFTPILGINFSPNEDWNIAVKYENKTYMTLTNKTKVDDLGLFPDGSPVNSDIPALLAVGVGYTGIDWLEAQLSYTGFFNNRVGFGANVRDLSSWQGVDDSKIRMRESDMGYEVGLGLQFNLSENFSISTGGLYGDQKVKDNYQSDFSYSNPSFTLGAGVMWKMTEKLVLDAGVSNTFYQDVTLTFTDPVVPSYDDTYGKTALTFAVGLSYSIF
mgnify:CR=1 FL=1